MKESQLDNKTAIATNDYVRMVDENGNSVKIKKDSFMAAIRDALPSIISDGETGGGSVLSIINGALKTRTDANLASVLGALLSSQTLMRKVFETNETTYTDYNNFVRGGVFYSGDAFNIRNCPVEILKSDASQVGCINIGNTYFTRGFQIAFSQIGIGIRFRNSTTAFTSWSYIKYNK